MFIHHLKGLLRFKQRPSQPALLREYLAFYNVRQNSIGWRYRRRDPRRGMKD
jgi:hypothetical protein